MPLYYHLKKQCIKRDDGIKTPKDIKYLYSLDYVIIIKVFEIFNFSIVIPKAYEVWSPYLITFCIYY